MNIVDHLVFACSDLESGIQHIADLFGVVPGRGGRHPAWGTHNAMLSLGESTYFEIIAPDPMAVEGFRRPSVFSGRGRGSLTTWAAVLDGLSSNPMLGRPGGDVFGEVLEGSRVTESGIRLEWSLTDPMTRIREGVVPFLIDWRGSPHPSQSSPDGCLLRELTLLDPDPSSVRSILSNVGIDLQDTVKIEASCESGILALIDTPRGEIEIRT